MSTGSSEEKTEILSILKQSKLFEGLDEKHLEKLAPLFKLKDVPAGHRFVEYKTASSELFLVVTGEAEVQIPLAGKQKASVLAKLFPGDSVGEFALLRDARRTATACALTDARLMRVYCADLQRLFEKEPTIGYHVLVNLGRVLVDRLSDTNLQLQGLMSNPNTVD